MKYWAPAISSLSYLLKSSAYSSSSPFPKQFLEGINKKNIIFQEMQMKNQNLSGYFLKSSIQNFSFLRNLDNKTHHLILEKYGMNQIFVACRKYWSAYKTQKFSLLCISSDLILLPTPVGLSMFSNKITDEDPLSLCIFHFLRFL